MNYQLRLAAKQDNAKRIHTLIQEGAKIDSLDSEGASAIMLAAKNQCHTAISALLSHGPNLNILDKRGMGLPEYQFPKDKHKGLSDIDLQTLRARSKLHADISSSGDCASATEIKRSERAL